MQYRIALVDDKRQIINSVSEELNHATEVELIFTASNGAEFLEKLKQIPADRLPQAVLMDIDMPIMNGIEAVRICTSIYTNIKFIMLTIFDNDDKLFDAIQAGAHGYLLKEERGSAIINAIKELLEEQGAPMTPRIARKALQLLTVSNLKHSANAGTETLLSDRELEILKCQVNGMDYRQTASALFISPNTVRNHISKIYDKLHISSKAQAVKLAVKNNWI